MGLEGMDETENGAGTKDPGGKTSLAKDCGLPDSIVDDSDCDLLIIVPATLPP